MPPLQSNRSILPPDVPLSQHFRLHEFCISQEAVRLGIANVPDLQAIDNLRRLAATLEVARSMLGEHPIVVSSGYRCRDLNAEVGGATTSAHLYGRAADFIVPAPGFSPRLVCQLLHERGLVYDQLIDEQGWVHLGIAQEDQPPRRQLLTAMFMAGQRTRYLPGLVR